MIEHIDKVKFQKSSQSSKGSKSSGSVPRPEQIKEEEDEDEARAQRASSGPVRSSSLVLPPSEARVAASSPGELTPTLEEEPVEQEPGFKANSAPVRPKVKPNDDIVRSKTMLSKSNIPKPAYFDLPTQEAEAETAEENPPGRDGVRRRDTISPPPPHVADDGEELGQEFAIRWVKIGSLPFTCTRHLRNPWNADREVKISRDGTEVEPSKSPSFRPCLACVLITGPSCRDIAHGRVGQAVDDHLASVRDRGTDIRLAPATLRITAFLSLQTSLSTCLEHCRGLQTCHS